MTDPIVESEDVQATGTSDASAAPSATPVPDIEAVMASFTKSLDERFQGFQSAMDRKINPLTKKLSALEAASLSPEQRDEQAQAEKDQEFENLRTENQLLRLRAAHPDAVDLITGAMGTQSLEEQIAFIESKLGKKIVAEVEAAAEVAAGVTKAGEVDLNNPGRKPRMGPESARFGAIDSDAAADAILANAGGGSLKSIREAGR